MRKLILMAIAGYVWKKFRDRDQPHHIARSGSGAAGASALPKQRAASKPAANHKTTNLEGSTT